MITIAPPEKPHAAEAELSLLPPEPISAPPIPEPEPPPPIPWHEDLDNHPEWRPVGGPSRRGPDGRMYWRDDPRNGMQWVPLRPDVGIPGKWVAGGVPVAFDPHRGLQMALDGARMTGLDRNPKPDPLEAELRALESEGRPAL